MSYQNPGALVSVDWLATNANDADVVILDATSHLPTTGRNAEQEFAEKHTAGAVRFNIDDIVCGI